MSSIRLQNVVKEFDGQVVVQGITLYIEDGEFVVLVGPSGCGKTTTLRMIAGLESASGGNIFIADRRVNDIAPKKRNIAMVFQSYALYPHMSVFENMSFALHLRGEDRPTIEGKVDGVARPLGLAELLRRKPRQLSGGQRQRVAMGRAIVRAPEAFLFDEPLSNLDAKLRVHMRTEIKRLHRRLGATIVYVTHDQVEAMTLADRIVVMNGGTIEQVGPPQEMYSAPMSKFVAGFIGSPAMNFIPCRLTGDRDALAVELDEDTRLPVPAARVERYRPFVDRPMELGIRPEHIREAGAGHPAQAVTAPVDVVEPMGMDTMVYFALGRNEEVCARVSPNAAVSAGEAMTFAVDMGQMHLIDPDSGRVV